MAPVTQPTGINLSQLFLEVTYSIKIARKHSIGISGIEAYQMFEAEGLQAFGQMSMNSEKLTNNDVNNSVGYGAKIGYLGKLTDKLSLGVEYQSKIFMSEFENYSGLFAEQGDFDIPSNWTVGLAYKYSKKLTLAFDVKQIRYTDVKAVSNPLTDPTIVPLGSDNGPGFAWQNLMIFKLGGQYIANKEWIYRAGYSYGLKNIPENQLLFNILAPGVSQNHIAAGFTRILSTKKNALDLSLMYSPANSLSGPNSIWILRQTIEIKMSQFELELGYSF